VTDGVIILARELLDETTEGRRLVLRLSVDMMLDEDEAFAADPACGGVIIDEVLEALMEDVVIADMLVIDVD